MMLAQSKSKDQSIKDLMQNMGQAARTAAKCLMTADTAAKNAALIESASAIRANASTILTANNKDIAAAKTRQLTPALIDRLYLDPDRLEMMAAGLQAIAALPDPVGSVISSRERPNGLRIEKIRIPLGVIGIIYESRPNVTADAGALALKSGNGVILRGGSESFLTNQTIQSCLKTGLRKAGLPEDAIQLVPVTEREAVGEMLQMTGLIDVIIPRGGQSLVKRVQKESRLPVLAHLAGLCHVYIDGAADAKKAIAITLNAKMRRPGICGAAETLLVDRKAFHILPALLTELIANGCEIRGDEQVRALDPKIRAASPADWETEYLDAILSVKMVDGVDGAVTHITRYGSGHTDCIVTEDAMVADRFLREVDSAIVLHNASTQFADGGEFGMGAEIGIATGRLHARGPVGLEELTTYKYVVRGDGQTRP